MNADHGANSKGVTLDEMRDNRYGKLDGVGILRIAKWVPRHCRTKRTENEFDAYIHHNLLRLIRYYILRGPHSCDKLRNT